jgi:hypothetical protein
MNTCFCCGTTLQRLMPEWAVFMTCFPCGKKTYQVSSVYKGQEEERLAVIAAKRVDAVCFAEGWITELRAVRKELTCPQCKCVHS